MLKPLLKNSMLVDKWSGRLKTVNEPRRTDYSRRKFGGWQKKRRNRNRRRKRTGDGRRMRGRGGLRLRRRSTLDRKSWKRQDRERGRLWSQRIAEKKCRKSRKAQTEK
jgi:hypothetical protein